MTCTSPAALLSAPVLYSSPSPRGAWQPRPRVLSLPDHSAVQRFPHAQHVASPPVHPCSTGLVPAAPPQPCHHRHGRMFRLPDAARLPTHALRDPALAQAAAPSPSGQARAYRGLLLPSPAAVRLHRHGHLRRAHPHRHAGAAGVAPGGRRPGPAPGTAGSCRRNGSCASRSCATAWRTTPKWTR